MLDEIKAGTVLMKEGARLPEALVFGSESCVPGWRLAKDLDGHGLDRKVHEAGWAFFFPAAEIEATVFGINAQQMVRRAVERILGDPRVEKFNSLEIARVTSVASERFPGVRFLTVAANPRHIQEGSVLFHAEGAREPGSSRNVGRSNYGVEPASGNPLREELSANEDPAAVW
jgi:hypothetical protein